MRLLLVQADVAEASLASILRKTGIVADLVETVDDAFDYLRTYAYDLIVLDQAPKGLDGVAALRRLRARQITTPILLLTASHCGQANAVALRDGADDLLVKPYHEDELVARIESIVRRRNGFARSALQVGPLVIDLASRQVSAHGQSVSVTCKEFAILELMALRKGQAVSKEKFLGHLYNGLDAPETRVIDVFICCLRKKLALIGLGGVIDTVRGHGYIMRELSDLGAEIIPIRPQPASAQEHHYLRVKAA